MANLVTQSMPMISSLNEPSSFSKPHVIVPSEFSSRYFRRIWATGFFSRPYLYLRERNGGVRNMAG